VDIPANDNHQLDQAQFKVVTSIDPHADLIIQETYQVNGTEVVNYVEKIIELQDKGVREALIALGWTPPKE